MRVSYYAEQSLRCKSTEVITPKLTSLKFNAYPQFSKTAYLSRLANVKLRKIVAYVSLKIERLSKGIIDSARRFMLPADNCHRARIIA